MEHFDRIEELARELHGEQKRKYTGEPYVNHTVKVAEIVKTYGGDESMVYAAILHDVLEDTPTTEDELARELHGEQKRKYTGEPYVNHTVKVAEIVKTYGGDESMVYAAILHDVLEDTPTTEDELFSYITEITGDIKLSMDVLRLVKELTDVYTTEDYPDINRKGRKEMEAIRLGKTSSKAQTIKYADLLDNSMDILSNDPKFAKVYLKEKEQILKYMNKGNSELYDKCFENLSI